MHDTRWRPTHPDNPPPKSVRYGNVYGGNITCTPDQPTHRLPSSSSTRHSGTSTFPWSPHDPSKSTSLIADVGKAGSTLAAAWLGPCDVLWWEQVLPLQKRWSGSCIQACRWTVGAELCSACSSVLRRGCDGVGGDLWRSENEAGCYSWEPQCSKIQGWSFKTSCVTIHPAAAERHLVSAW